MTRLSPAAEVAAQQEHIRAVRTLIEPRALAYHIVTLGCQMNVRDSESIAGLFEAMGMTEVPNRESADLILYNTCCVRENAENRALGNIIWLKELKADKPDLLICVAGCMMQEPGMGERVRRMYPFIDLAIGTHNTHRLPELLREVLTNRRRMIEVLDVDGSVYEGLPVKRSSPHTAFISIVYGCNNFCSYCIVPYVRGRERSRKMEDILSEARTLMDSGVQEITLLGQNVNSFRDDGDAFPELLYRLDRMGVPRIRFMTSHPKDMNAALIDCYRELPRLCKHLHLPVQAGSDRILQAMNRGYTAEEYIALVEALRNACPQIGLTTDLIVGFPGEMDEDFEQTLALTEHVRYDAAFTFIYSPRIGTRAASMPNETPMEEKSERIQRLIDLQQRITHEILTEQIGKTEPVLVESESARNPGEMCGKTDRSHLVNFPGNTRIIGKVIPVKITSAGRNTLRGEQII